MHSSCDNCDSKLYTSSKFARCTCHKRFVSPGHLVHGVTSREGDVRSSKAVLLCQQIFLFAGDGCIYMISLLWTVDSNEHHGKVWVLLKHWDMYLAEAVMVVCGCCH